LQTVSRPFRRRSAAARRIVLVMMLVLGFVLQPVMAAYGQLHETLAHLGEGIAHVEGDAHDSGADDGMPASPDDAEYAHEASVLHALSHHAHCCAQPQWLPPGGLAVPLQAVRDARPPCFDYDAPADSRTDTPFRPPIFG
jgi:hypothetical protein